MEDNQRSKEFDRPFDHSSVKQTLSNSAIELRKSKRESQAQKCRNINEAPEWIKLNTHYPDSYTESDLPEILSNLSIHEDSSFLYVAQAIRKLLCSSESANGRIVISEVINFIPIWLQRDDFTQLQYETAWICTNISSSEYCQILEQIGAIKWIVNLLNSSRSEVRYQASWAISNIAANTPEERNLLVELGCLDLLALCLKLDGVKKKEQGTFVWAICNIIRKRPPLDFIIVKKVFEVLFPIVFSSNLIQVIDICWAINVYVSESEIIQVILTPEYLHRFSELCDSNKSKVVTIVLKVFGGIFYHSSISVKVCLEAGFAQVLNRCLRRKKSKEVIKNAIWTTANITGEKSNQLRYLFENNIFELIFDLAENGVYQIRAECAWAICNACVICSFEECVKLVELGVINTLTSLLTSEINPSIILEALMHILKSGKELVSKDGQELFVMAFENTGGVEVIETLALLKDNLKISLKAEKVLCLVRNQVEAEVGMEMEDSKFDI